MWSQGDLAQRIAASREIIGKYERNENLPSIEMVAKMARARHHVQTCRL